MTEFCVAKVASIEKPVLLEASKLFVVPVPFLFVTAVQESKRGKGRQPIKKEGESDQQQGALSSSEECHSRMIKSEIPKVQF